MISTAGIGNRGAHLQGPGHGGCSAIKNSENFGKKKWYGKRTVGSGVDWKSRIGPSAHRKKDLNLIAHSRRLTVHKKRERERVVVRPDQNRTKQNELGTIQSSTSQARGEEALLTRIRGNESEPGWICTPVGAGRGERQRAAPARCLSLGAARRGGSARARRPRGAGGSFVRDERLAARPPARPRGRTARRE
jgi:hypothetical protein